MSKTSSSSASTTARQATKGAGVKEGSMSKVFGGQVPVPANNTEEFKTLQAAIGDGRTSTVLICDNYTNDQDEEIGPRCFLPVQSYVIVDKDTGEAVATHIKAIPEGETFWGFVTYNLERCEGLRVYEEEDEEGNMRPVVLEIPQYLYPWRTDKVGNDPQNLKLMERRDVKVLYPHSYTKRPMHVARYKFERETSD